MKSTILPNWELQQDGEGFPYWLNRATGEVEEAVLQYVRYGSQTLSPEEVARRRKYGKMMQERYDREMQIVETNRIRTEQEKELGMFVYTSADKGAFSDLSADMLARAVYLASHLDFDIDCLWATQRKQIKRSELPKVMNMSKAATDNFWGVVKDKYFCRDKDGFLHTKGKSFVMWHLSAAPSIEYQKLYISALKELYEKIDSRQL